MKIFGRTKILRSWNKMLIMVIFTVNKFSILSGLIIATTLSIHTKFQTRTGETEGWFRWKRFINSLRCHKHRHAVVLPHSFTCSHITVKPMQRTQRQERSGANARDVRNVRNVTKWRHYWRGQWQPPATMAYAAGTLPSCGRHARNY